MRCRWAYRPSRSRSASWRPARDASALENVDAVDLADRREPTGDDERRAPAHEPADAAFTSSSDSGSSAEVASSRSRMRGSRTRARAIANADADRPTDARRGPPRRCPALGLVVHELERVRIAQRLDDAGVVRLRHPVRDVLADRALERTDSCGTTETKRRAVRISRSCMSAPSRRICPPVGRTNPSTRFSSVDLPDPDDPTSATVSPAVMSRSISWSASASAPG